MTVFFSLSHNFICRDDNISKHELTCLGIKNIRHLFVDSRKITGNIKLQHGER